MANTKNLWPIYFVVFVDTFQFQFVCPLIFPAFEKYAIDELANGWKVSDCISLLWSLGYAAQAIGAPMLGWVGDRYGRKPLFMVSTFVAAVSLTTFGYSTSLQTALVALAIKTFAGSTDGVAQAYIREVTTSAEQANAASKVAGARALGLILGPKVGSALYAFGQHALLPAEYELDGIKVACLAASGVSMLNLAVVVAFLKQDRSFAVGRTPWTPSIQYARMPWHIYIIGMASFFVVQARCAFASFGQLYLTHKFFTEYNDFLGIYLLPDVDASTTFYANICSIMGLTILVVTLILYRPVTDLLGPSITVLVGGVLAVGGFSCLAVAPTKELFMASVVLWACGGQLMSPAFQVLTGSLIPANQNGKAFGVQGLVRDVSKIISPLLFSRIFHVNADAVWYCGGLFSLIYVAIVLWLFRQRAADTPNSLEAPLISGDDPENAV